MGRPAAASRCTLSRFQAQTIDGERTLTTVIAQRPGSTERDADRDPRPPRRRRARLARRSCRRRRRCSSWRACSPRARPGARSCSCPRAAAAAGTPERPTSPPTCHGPFDAAIVLGDLAGARATQADGRALLRRLRLGAAAAAAHASSAAITREAGSDPGAPSVLGQLGHLAFPFDGGRAGPARRRRHARGARPGLRRTGALRARGGERANAWKATGAPCSSAVDALDTAPDVSSAMQTGVVVQRQTIPAWAVRLLVGTLLLGPLLVAVDCARAPAPPPRAGRALDAVDAACALPFLRRGPVRRLLGLIGALSSAPPAAAMPSALPFDSLAARAVVASRARARARLAAVAASCAGSGSASSPDRRGGRAVDAARAARPLRRRLGGQSVHRPAARARRCTSCCWSPRRSCARAALGALALRGAGACAARAAHLLLRPSARPRPGRGRVDGRAAGRRRARRRSRRRCCGASPSAAPWPRAMLAVVPPASEPRPGDGAIGRDHDSRSAVLRGSWIARAGPSRLCEARRHAQRSELGRSYPTSMLPCQERRRAVEILFDEHVAAADGLLGEE